MMAASTSYPRCCQFREHLGTGYQTHTLQAAQKMAVSNE
jgi:hypothetical protein